MRTVYCLFLRELYFCAQYTVFCFTESAFLYTLYCPFYGNCVFAHSQLSFFFTRIVFLCTIYCHLTGFDMRLVFRALYLRVLLQIFTFVRSHIVSSAFYEFHPLCYRHTSDTTVIALSDVFQPALSSLSQVQYIYASGLPASQCLQFTFFSLEREMLLTHNVTLDVEFFIIITIITTTTTNHHHHEFCLTTGP